MAAQNKKFAIGRNMIGIEFPIGFILPTIISVNPVNYLNYGKWEEFAQGRTLIGAGDNGKEIFMAGETGGSSNSVAQHTHIQDSHNHTQISHNHTQNPHNHEEYASDGTTERRVASKWGSGSTDSYSLGVTGRYYNSIQTTGSATPTNIATTATNVATVAINQITGENGGNLPPYIVIYYFVRMA